MTTRRFIAIAIAGALILLSAMDLVMRTSTGSSLVPSPTGVISAIIGCTIVLLVEGHRRFDLCEERISAKLARRDMNQLGLEHARNLHSINED